MGINDQTGTIQMEIKGLVEPKRGEAQRICLEDLNELITSFVQDKTTIERGLFDDELVPEELTQVRMGKIVKARFPNLDDEDQETVRQHAVAALNLIQQAKKELTEGNAGGGGDAGGTLPERSTAPTFYGLFLAHPLSFDYLPCTRAKCRFVFCEPCGTRTISHLFIYLHAVSCHDSPPTMKPTFALFALCALAQPTFAQLRLSEFMADNVQSVPDIVDFEAYPDWIEIQNTSASPVSLNGYFLSDDPTKPLKWMIPGAASVPANGFFKVWADGHDASPGQSYPRGYWPWRNFTVEGYHTNFGLSATGESVVLSQGSGITSAPLIVAADPVPASASTWKYLASASAAPASWAATNFVDTSWASGVGPFGYGDPWIATTVPFGTSSSAKYITTYFRNSFTVANPALIAGLTMRLQVDDGAVVYLNGTEIVRQNLPTGAVSYSTLAPTAISGTDESDYTTYSVPTSLLVAGANVIAVEVHQNTAGSSDLSFDLSLDAISVASYTVLDSITFGQQIGDVSIGRSPADDTVWTGLSQPTPGAANVGNTVPDLRVKPVAVTVSLNSGFFSTPQTVTLTAPSGDIRYTLNGALPSETSALYTAPISITATTILRARVFAAGKPTSLAQTRSYFFGETVGSVPFVSVVADPKVLFDNTIGIYYNLHEPVSSTTYALRDVYKGKDAPGTFEFFAPNTGALGFRAEGGYRMGGENNWAAHRQRALNFGTDSDYGGDVIKYDAFPGTKIPLHASLTLRDGGDRWDTDMLRDGLWASVTKDQMLADTTDYRPVVVFINGSYWGIHDMRPRWDDQWFFEHKRLNADDIDHLLYGHIDSNSITLGADKGDTTAWNEFMTFINTADLNVPANWAFVESRINLDSFMDFVIAESYANNGSWEHNREFWRDRKAGGKWHWFLPDMDRTFQTSSLNSNVMSSMMGSDHVLVRLKNSTVFKNRLAQRYAAHIASTFKPARVQSIVDTLGALINSEISRHVTKWSSSGGTTLANRTAALNDIKSYMTQRDALVHAEIQSQLGVAAAVNLTLTTGPGGRVLIANVPVPAGTVKMFPNIAFDIKAEAAPGYVFTGWTGATGGASSTLTLTGAATLTANFAASNETLIGGTWTGLTALTAASSPYAVTSDIIVPAGSTLNIGAGVTLNLASGVNIRVQGVLNVTGTAAEPVWFIGRNGDRWGGISFEAPASPSALAHFFIRGATRGFDPTKYPYAISGSNATITLDFADIDESEGPIFAKGGSTILRDSRIHTPYTGDGINVKAGYAETWRTTFVGNNAPDTDAIDYDGVTNGIISDCLIHRFRGFNSDGVDVGEACVNLLVQRNRIYFNSDKGFSLGQGSTANFRHNLVVGCVLGIGIKDFNSVATLDQNTFVNCGTGISAYEKNFGDGGGTVTAENMIISKASLAPFSADALSSISINYSLSDTTVIPGTGNIVTNPMFMDPVVLNYSLKLGSPAINAGNPAHALDTDGSLADMGAYYSYTTSDYPYTIGSTIVINEVLANSGLAPDWIELHNRTSASVNIGGWFLSDSATNPQKYLIPAGTIVPAGGYVVFDEANHFGAASIDPGRFVGFSLSDVGESVYLTSTANDYENTENFGPSLEGETLGNYYKPSTDRYNFVAMSSPTPGAANSYPKVGPIVITEVHYQPGGAQHADSEFFELKNISNAPVTLYDGVKAAAWKISDGVDYDFPTGTPITFAAGERIVFTRSLTRFNAAYTVPGGTRVFQWLAGRLSNEGEQLQLAQPAALDDLNVRQFAREDRVTYEITSPWPNAWGSALSLQKIVENEYGNDVANWIAATPTPGERAPGPSFVSWIAGTGLPLADQDPNADPDGDGRSNLVEYALGSNAMTYTTGAPFAMHLSGGYAQLDFLLPSTAPGASVTLEMSDTLTSWTPVLMTPQNLISGQQQRRAYVPMSGAGRRFFRMVVIDAP